MRRRNWASRPPPSASWYERWKIGVGHPLLHRARSGKERLTLVSEAQDALQDITQGLDKLELGLNKTARPTGAFGGGGDRLAGADDELADGAAKPLFRSV
ncbi:Uncharacterised protein [Kluyvera cryocrescens]|uniref:Uncharacterized protein n=1 Tax=Kluyvera cryocrescens TaxID=580 RepID=A0A485AJS8_KLUCR|nr:Uncharacterised protein [Kluyvera cryocrescens]